jgi:hypothetical protein
VLPFGLEQFEEALGWAGVRVIGVVRLRIFMGVERVGVFRSKWLGRSFRMHDTGLQNRIPALRPQVLKQF